MDIASSKRAAVCAMVDFGCSDLHTPLAKQEDAVEDYFAAINANKSDADIAEKERYMGVHRIMVRCIKAMSRQQIGKVYIALVTIAEKSRKRP